MKVLFTITALLLFTINSFGQKANTVLIQKQNLEMKYLITGKSTYIVYFKQTMTGPAERITLIKMNVEAINIDGKKAFAITQQWDSGDAVSHTSYTVHDAEDFSTIKHEDWWKRKDGPYSAKFDFKTKQVTVEGVTDEAKKAQIIKDFNDSFEAYNLCWHSDLTIFPLFPYKDGRILKVNFYDPGAGKAEVAEYVIKGSETLRSSSGKNIDCWIMEREYTTIKGYQRFWISKKTREVLKEEDQFPSGFRYKMKIGISGEN